MQESQPLGERNALILTIKTLGIEIYILKIMCLCVGRQVQ